MTTFMKIDQSKIIFKLLKKLDNILNIFVPNGGHEDKKEDMSSFCQISDNLTLSELCITRFFTSSFSTVFHLH